MPVQSSCALALGVAALPLALPPAAARAAAPVEEEIVVEGSRLGQTLARTGAAVTVITREDLREQGASFLADALAAAPAVTLNQSGPFGGAASVRIRGNGTDQTLVLIDGVPVGDTSAVGGAFDFARLDPAQIEKVEILRGPQSTLWGSEAIGGVVSITTAEPDGTRTLFAEAGSFDTFRGGLALSGATEGGGWRIGVSGISSQGISKADADAGNSEADGHRAQSVSVAYNRALGPLLLDASAFASSAETEFDSFDFTAPGSISDGDERSEVDELTLSLRARTANTRLLDHSLLAGGSLIERRNYAGGAPGFDAAGRRAILRYQATADAYETLTFAFGGEADLREAGDRDSAILSAFALAELEITESFVLSGGLRRDDHDAFEAETTGRVAAAWTPRQGVTFRASWGQGFKAPSLFQETFFCCGAPGPNPDLRPERSAGVDAGVRLSAPRLALDLGVFAQETEDLIDFSFTSGGYVNIAEAETRGVEVSGTVDLFDWLDIGADYAFIEAEDGSGARLARIPRHSGDLRFIVEPAGPWSGTLLVRYNGEEEDNFGTVDAWTRVDATARYALGDGLELYARGENLLDADYQQVFGYGTPGRSGTVGIRYVY